ncbi:MAG: L-glutamate gamma-semialdehyde dehydrogenase [Bacteroidales bacterium]|jgi:1-pyrroline-5-carboxylate dehydrogenase
MISISTPPTPVNEEVRTYAPGTADRAALVETICELKKKVVEIPMVIDGKDVLTGQLEEIRAPHDHQMVLARYHMGSKEHVKLAIKAALKARQQWSETSWEQRASVFLKAASLLSGPYRYKINAATMLGQSKNIHQAEIDAASESIDFLNFNVQFMADIYSIQPENNRYTWNRLEQRPLEGFIYAVSPFNFTSIALNLATAPALMGNVVVWKPAQTQIYSAKVLMDVFRAAGLPDGVINMVFAPGKEAADVALGHRELAGIHFTGSTEVFQSLWTQVGNSIKNYKSFPRLVGETGGKDFILAHPSARPIEVATALSRGSFEYQGQKCSAASRAYIPESLWPKVMCHLLDDLHQFKMGSPEDFTNFINAVIDEKSFDKLTGHIEMAKNDHTVEIIAGGNYSKETGYFIEPTVILTRDPDYPTMHKELFGPVLTIYVYPDIKFDETLDLVDSTSPYALTGAIFATDRYAINQASKRLVHSAGNFYINDKPTGAVVGRQPFGGSRLSGTNDKAGSMLNLLRWVSPRTIKECFLPPVDHTYPFLSNE